MQFQVLNANSRVDKFEVGWALAQHDTSVNIVRKNAHPKQTTTIFHNMPHSCWAKAQPTRFYLPI